MLRIIVIFASAQTAATRVAGLPAIARAAHSAMTMAQTSSDGATIVLALPEGQLPNSDCHTEIARLLPGMAPRVMCTDALDMGPRDCVIAGECLQLQPRPSGSSAWSLDDVMRFHCATNDAELVAMMRHADRGILRNTVKPTDGLVSRHINRPVSTRITGALLRHTDMRPGHATAFTGLTAVIMLSVMVSGGAGGLIAGAVLFQTASLIDGVDGEMARATFRTSARGASCDALIDGATNGAFLLGLGLNLARHGSAHAQVLGMASFACLGTGLTVLGVQALIQGSSVNFDALKHHVRRRNTPLANWLIWLTMRDFLALASAAFILSGLAWFALYALTIGACLWMIAVIALAASSGWGHMRCKPRQCGPPIDRYISILRPE